MLVLAFLMETRLLRSSSLLVLFLLKPGRWDSENPPLEDAERRWRRWWHSSQAWSCVALNAWGSSYGCQRSVGVELDLDGHGCSQGWGGLTAG